MTELFERLYKIAEEFGTIAKNVNKSSLDRKEHSEKAITNIDLSYDTGAILLSEIKKIARENLQLSDKNNMILNTCRIFLVNLERQEDILGRISVSPVNPDLIARIKSYMLKLRDSLKLGLSYLDRIINNNNEIILLDNLIIYRKNFQRERIELLKSSTQKILKDSIKAIEGSQSNLNRGAALAAQFKDIEKLVKNKDITELKKLAEEAKIGTAMAEKVNSSSRSQFEFVEQVNRFTKQLHDESVYINELITRKHELFNINLEPIAELAVLIAVEMFEYISIRETLKELDINDPGLDEQTYMHVNNLAAYILSICENVESVAVLNFDMTDSIAANADLEKKAVDLTEKEISYYTEIKNESAAMTEATRYPVEGSAKNILNGGELEKLLNELIGLI